MIVATRKLPMARSSVPTVDVHGTLTQLTETAITPSMLS